MSNAFPVSDKLTQNEIDELEGALNEGKMGDTSLLQTLLSKLPPGILPGSNQGDKLDQIQSNAAAAQEQHQPVSPKDNEEFTMYIKSIYKAIMPAIEFHDSIMKSISSAVERIPILPKIIEQLEEQLSVFVFAIIAPFIVPLIHQVKNELQTGSYEIIESSQKEQHVVFNDDYSSNPTHSMLSKDHFSNVSLQFESPSREDSSVAHTCTDSQRNCWPYCRQNAPLGCATAYGGH